MAEHRLGQRYFLFVPDVWVGARPASLFLLLSKAALHSELSAMLIETPEREGWTIFSSLFLLCVGGAYGLGDFGQSARRNLASLLPRFTPDGSINRFLSFADARFADPRPADPLGPEYRGERVGRRHNHVQDGGAERRRALLCSLPRPWDHPKNGPRIGSQEGSSNVQQSRR